MTSILDKLKNKPIPAKPTIVTVKPTLAETVTIGIKVEDKRGQGLVDREKILEKIKEKRGIKRQRPETIPRPLLEESDGLGPSTEMITETESTEPMKIKVKKKRSKLVIKSESNAQIAPIETKPRLTPKPMPPTQEAEPTDIIVIDDVPLEERLPKPEPNVIIRSSSYYQNNREIFINFINNLFEPYREQIMNDEKEISCENSGGDFKELLIHQKVVRDYINLYTPYRGLLLYHGLGSGKTCSSIAIAEGLKTSKQIVIMTPASLRKNYLEEIKNCGDPIYKKKQYWEFIDTSINPKYADSLKQILHLDNDFIKRQGGAWLINVKKESNYEDLTTEQKLSLDNQINKMLGTKYQFINYNGLRNSHLQQITKDYSINPFDNKVVIIDEAHNLVSRIVNKMKKEESLSYRMYNYLMAAQNCKIIMLSGTPIINYPNEIAVLFNILRGYIKTWNIPLNVKTRSKINKQKLQEIFSTDKRLDNILDVVEYKSSTGILTVTKNPFGFINKYNGGTYDGVTVNDRGQIDDDGFIKLLTSILTKNDIEIIPTGIRVDLNKALPDHKETFENLFIDFENDTLKNSNMFKRRIIGLASYFPDLTQLMPEYDVDKNLQIINIPMSDYQFSIYEAARVQERKLEEQQAKRKRRPGKEDEDSVSTYRIFSRAFCNFVFPQEIGRPMPIKAGSKEVGLDDLDEDILDGASAEMRLENIDGRYELDDKKELETELDKIEEDYDVRIQQALKKLKENAATVLSPEGLKTYGPKLLNVLENIKDPDHEGSHLFYSQFRTIEGIGVFKLVLEQNGFAEFKLRKNSADKWIVDIKEEDQGKPTFVLYTGTESVEQKEIIRKVFNGMWDDIPQTVREYVLRTAVNNNMGQIIKLFMITASGAEGISLKNVRYVHILEPYWHPVRIEQIIGRARRICSHQDLPKHLQNVQVFLYLMNFTEEQMTSDESIELRLKDNSKKNARLPLTSDQALYEIATIKQEINKLLLRAIKESAIDCALHTTVDSKEPLVCYSFGSPVPDKFSYLPNYEADPSDDISAINKTTISWKANKVTIKGKDYALNKATGEVFDFDSYIQATKKPGINPILRGKLVKKGAKTVFEEI